MMMVPGPIPQPLCRQASGSGCMGLLGVLVNSDVTVPQVPGKNGAWLVPRVLLVAASGLYGRGHRGCSGGTATVVLNLGAVACEANAVCGAEAPQKGFLFLICLLVVLCFLAPSKLPSAKCIPTPLLAGPRKYASPLCIWELGWMVLKLGERRRGKRGDVLEGGSHLKKPVQNKTKGQLNVKVRSKGKKEEKEKEEMWHFWSEAEHPDSRAVISLTEKGALWVRIWIFFFWAD